jgi:dTDP-4-dehydrorhamnose reductase
MKIAIVGAAGQLGTELGYQFGDQAIRLCKAALDVTDRHAVLRYLTNIRPAAVINAAAYTNVDAAEANTKLCRRINIEAVGYLAEACSTLNCPFVHVSSDYVFGMDRNHRTPYTEADIAGPQGTYAKSKLDGESLAASTPKHFIVRTCGVYGVHDGLSEMKNFVNTMLRLGETRNELKIVADQICTPTSVTELANAIRFLLSTDKYGLYNIVNTGETTWIDFATEIFDIAEMSVELTPITTKEFGATAARPAYSVLDTTKYHALNGPKMSHWKKALAAAMARRPVVAL